MNSIYKHFYELNRQIWINRQNQLEASPGFVDRSWIRQYSGHTEFWRIQLRVAVHFVLPLA